MALVLRRPVGRFGSQTRRVVLRAFAGLSDGLEPSTPFLPWNFSGNRWQPVATLFACFCGFRVDRICDRLPPVATTGLHKGSIRRSACTSSVLARCLLGGVLRDGCNRVDDYRHVQRGGALPWR